MNEREIAERLRKAILDNGGYEKISELTQLSVSTLKRCAAGQTEPKFSTVAKIAEVTRKNISYIAYGIGDENAAMSMEGENRIEAKVDHLKKLYDGQKKIIEHLEHRLKQTEEQVQNINNKVTIGTLERTFGIKR
ncbi:hypothetical protein RJD39_22120 [Vibrio scophthalmi]|uniref:hypothetical protein n=1 Tax=Vibrio scophthalmi TaxID=45658 RepID=UPI003873111E